MVTPPGTAIGKTSPVPWFKVGAEVVLTISTFAGALASPTRQRARVRLLSGHACEPVPSLSSWPALGSTKYVALAGGPQAITTSVSLASAASVESRLASRPASREWLSGASVNEELMGDSVDPSSPASPTDESCSDFAVEPSVVWFTFPSEPASLPSWRDPELRPPQPARTRSPAKRMKAGSFRSIGGRQCKSRERPELAQDCSRAC